MNIQEKNILFTPGEKIRICLPAVIAWFISFALSLRDILQPPQPVTIYTIVLLVLVVLDGLANSTIILFQLDRHPILHWILAAAAGLLIGLLFTIPAQRHSIGFFLMACVNIPSFAIFLGRWPTYLYVFILQSFIYALSPYLVSTILGVAIFDYGFFLIIALTTVEVITNLRQVISKQMKRWQTMNRVVTDMASSLDIEQVIQNCCQALYQAMDADTYYFGVLDGDNLQLKLLYDKGKFYDPEEFTIKDTLAGMVIDSRTPLKFGNLSSEIPSEIIKSKRIGADQFSKSWMGAQLIVDEKVIGLVAVASYRNHAFTSADFELLVNISHQVSNAMHNAIHHHHVLDLAQKDAMTGTLNHDAFIKALKRTVDLSTLSRSSFSLIMLDVDDFKEYNDQYGHLIGDDILKFLSSVIIRNIKDTDLVGRWGGEEFAICLPETNQIQALQVAERIRISMVNKLVQTSDGKPIHGPTVSLGIAIFPYDSSDVIGLVNLADQRLYQAKKTGKNQTQIGDRESHI